MTLRRYACLSAAALALLSLGACKKEGVVAKDESVESVAKKVAASEVKPRPGRWESSMKLARMDMPGMPPQMKEAMSKQMGAVQTFATCLTPEEASKPEAGFFQKGASGCKYDHFVMADGRIDAEMTCKQQGREMKTTMQGSYGEDVYDVTVKSQAEMQPGKPMNVEMSIASRRTGDCTGTEEK